MAAPFKALIAITPSYPPQQQGYYQQGPPVAPPPVYQQQPPPRAGGGGGGGGGGRCIEGWNRIKHLISSNVVSLQLLEP
ncbi:unnamed protein product [Sphagnum jensenii]|uniref:Uncharacterized protein n=1 Tax=Sphagnum jensenii TaxID=128206 RepID=A0ABP1ABP3_9BRYO